MRVQNLVKSETVDWNICQDGAVEEFSGGRLAISISAFVLRVLVKSEERVKE